MSRLRVALVFGTRPEAIKLAPVLRALEARPDRFDPRVWLTGQHREMLDQVLRVFHIEPHRDLALMRPDQTVADVAASAVARLAPLMEEERPDAVLVQGDTITTFAAAFAAYLHRIPVGHVEAGLRTGDRYRPFPEEINRRLTSVLAQHHFAPTQGARRNLLLEGHPDESILVTGNTVVDALQMVLRDPHRFRNPSLAALDPGRPIVLITMHRRESFGGPLRAAAEAIRILAEARPQAQLVFPVHRNPRVRRPVEELLGGIPSVFLVEPLEYREFVHLMAGATLALTDSGGIQEEAPTLGLPVLVLRDVTERPEAVEAGTARLVGTDTERIVASAVALLDDPGERKRMMAAGNPFGDGRAAERIADALPFRQGPG